MNIDKKYINRFLWFVGIAIVLLGASQLIDRHTQSKEGMVYVTVETFKLENRDGYGYRILADDKPYITQTIIPGLSGVNVFHTEDEAKKVGIAVKNKIVNGKMPSISENELKELGITW